MCLLELQDLDVLSAMPPSLEDTNALRFQEQLNFLEESLVGPESVSKLTEELVLSKLDCIQQSYEKNVVPDIRSDFNGVFPIIIQSLHQIYNLVIRKISFMHTQGISADNVELHHQMQAFNSKLFRSSCAEGYVKSMKDLIFKEVVAKFQIFNDSINEFIDQYAELCWDLHWVAYANNLFQLELLFDLDQKVEVELKATKAIHYLVDSNISRVVRIDNVLCSHDVKVLVAFPVLVKKVKLGDEYVVLNHGILFARDPLHQFVAKDNPPIPQEEFKESHVVLDVITQKKAFDYLTIM